MRFSRQTILSAILAVSLGACGGVESKAEYPTSRFPGDKDATYGEREGIFGKGGINLLGSGKDKKKNDSGITVNAYLWRAALDTVLFMPLASADPFGGTIITDWYEAPDAPGERVKTNVFIMGSALRTDAIKVTLFRQVAIDGIWQSAPVDEATAHALEEAILNRARQLSVTSKEK